MVVVSGGVVCETVNNSPVENVNKGGRSFRKSSILPSETTPLLSGSTTTTTYSTFQKEKDCVERFSSSIYPNETTPLLSNSTTKYLTFQKEKDCVERFSSNIGTIQSYKYNKPASFSPNALHLISVNSEGKATIYSKGGDGLLTQKQIINHSGKVVGSRVSPDSSHIAIATDESKLLIYGLDASGSWIEKIVIGEADKNRSAISEFIDFSSDGLHAMRVNSVKGYSQLTICSQGEDSSWTKTATFNYNDKMITSARFTPSGPNILVTNTGQDYTSLDSHDILVTDTGLESRDITMAIYYPDPDKKNVWICQAQDSDFSLDSILCLNPNSSEIVIINDSPEMKIYDLEKRSWREKGMDKDSSSARLAKFSPNGRYLIISFRGGKVQLYSQGKDKLWTKQQINSRNENDHDVQEVKFSPDSNHMMLAGNSEATIYRLKEGVCEEKTTTRFNCDGYLINFSPDSCHVMASTNDGQATIYGLKEGEWEVKIIIPYKGRGYSASFSPDGSCVVTTSGVVTTNGNENVEIYGLNTEGSWECKGSISYNGKVGSTKFSPDCNYVIITKECDGKKDEEIGEATIYKLERKFHGSALDNAAIS